MRRALVLLAVAACHYDEPTVGVDVGGPPPDSRHDAVASCAAYTIVGQAGRYRFTSGNVDYPHAAMDCTSDGGHLVKIEEVVEDAFIDTAFINAGISVTSYVWIGLSDPTMTDNYVWSDGTPLGDYNGFPNSHVPNDTDGMHNCADKRGDGPWALFFCDTVQKGFCECD